MIEVGFILPMTLMLAFAEKLRPATRTHWNLEVLVNLCGVAVTTPTALTRTNSASIWPDAPTRNSDPGQMPAHFSYPPVRIAEQEDA